MPNLTKSRGSKKFTAILIMMIDLKNLVKKQSGISQNLEIISKSPEKQKYQEARKNSRLKSKSRNKPQDDQISKKFEIKAEQQKSIRIG